jgi:TolB-like protein
MTRKRREVLDILASIADGQPVDWDVLSSGAAAPDIDTLRKLRIIAGVADLHRSLGADDEVAVEDAPSRVIGRIEPRVEPGGVAVDGTPWGPFVLREQLGSGTSADVFRAYEPKLDRDVALKLFKPAAQSSRDRRGRMLREARTLARVQHDSVVRVFGADEHDGRVGIWMELIRGRTLEAELTDRGRWSAREAAAAGQDLCRALAAVHNAGFVHGDIKPQNIIREEGGRLVLMDFGARKVRHAGAQGPVSGTPMYLAPEVLAGDEPSVASDVYSFGVLLYHLVTGSYPVVAASLDELQTRHSNRQMTRLSDSRPDLESTFVRVVERALAIDPAERFQSAGEMEAALARVLGAPAPQPIGWWDRLGRARKSAVAAVAVLAVAASALILWRLAAPVPDDGSLAVLPFRSVGGQEQAVSLSEGVSADLTSLLARLPGMRMVSGMSVQQFRDTSRPPAEIGQTLGVRTLVAGVVQLSGDRISVAVELVDSQTSRQIWSDRFDRRIDELFSTQSEIARRIAAALHGRLSSNDAALFERKPMQYRAFELYSLGRYHWNKRTPEGMRRAIQYFEEAAAADPTSALPYAGLSDAYVLSESFGDLPPLDAPKRAETAARQQARIHN